MQPPKPAEHQNAQPNSHSSSGGGATHGSDRSSGGSQHGTGTTGVNDVVGRVSRGTLCVRISKWDVTVGPMLSQDENVWLAEVVTNWAQGR